MEKDVFVSEEKMSYRSHTKMLFRCLTNLLLFPFYLVFCFPQVTSSEFIYSCSATLHTNRSDTYRQCLELF